ncbi:hypothetical protein HYS95_03940 [Candidatus Daviesbacteria bacterium]|nr:hypothetical protein [Candidatus Daviesbacteria bacterium]
MDNLPNDPSNPNNGNNNNPPPLFGSTFSPHTNPPDPNNPYASPPQPQQPIPQPPTPPTPNPPNTPNLPEDPHHATYSEVAQHKLRDSHGRFATDHIPQDPAPQTVSAPSFWRKILGYIINYFKKMTIKRFLTLVSAIYLITTNGPIQNGIEYFFPYSSPILHRQTAHQGILQTTGSGQYQLLLPDNSVYTLYFKPSASLINLKKINEAVVKGNLTWTPYVIENAEVYPLNITLPENPPAPVYNPPASNSAQQNP